MRLTSLLVIGISLVSSGQEVRSESETCLLQLDILQLCTDEAAQTLIPIKDGEAAVLTTANYEHIVVRYNRDKKYPLDTKIDAEHIVDGYVRDAKDSIFNASLDDVEIGGIKFPHAVSYQHEIFKDKTSTYWQYGTLIQKNGYIVYVITKPNENSPKDAHLEMHRRIVNGIHYIGSS